MNKQRREKPRLFWFGLMLPIDLIALCAAILGIAWLVEHGWLK
jgi:hypothetical protein